MGRSFYLDQLLDAGLVSEGSYVRCKHSGHDDDPRYPSFIPSRLYRIVRGGYMFNEFGKLVKPSARFYEDEYRDPVD